MAEAESSDARLKRLLGKSGEEFVQAVAEELANLNREIATLNRELNALTAYQGSRDRWLAIEEEKQRIAPLPRVVRIEPDQLLRFQDGFFPVEHTSDGKPFRWTGPSPQFSFDIFIDRSRNVEVRLDVVNCIDFEAQKNISLLVDGESVSVNIEESAPGFVVNAILPPREGRQGTSLIFLVPATIVPPGTDETRSLGVAFTRFTAISGVASQSDAEQGVSAQETGTLESVAAHP